MKVQLKLSAWEFPPAINPSTYGFDYEHHYLVEYRKESNGIKSIKLIGGYLYDANYFEEVKDNSDCIKGGEI